MLLVAIVKMEGVYQMTLSEMKKPKTKPSLDFFRPYHETIIGFVVITALVAVSIV